MRKPPPNLPAVGDHVRLKGRKPEGQIITINSENQWTTVAWKSKEAGPQIVHLYELEKLLKAQD